MKPRSNLLALALILAFVSGCRSAEVSSSKATYEGIGPTVNITKVREGPRSIEIIIERGEAKSHPVFIPVPDVSGGD